MYLDYWCVSYEIQKGSRQYPDKPFFIKDSNQTSKSHRPKVLSVNVTAFIYKRPWLMDLVKKICIKRKLDDNITIVQNEYGLGNT